MRIARGWDDQAARRRQRGCRIAALSCLAALGAAAILICFLAWQVGLLPARLEREIPSPDGRRIACVYANRWYEFVYLRWRGERIELDEDGRVPCCAPVGLNCDSVADVHWVGNTDLYFSGRCTTNGGRPIASTGTWNDVTVHGFECDFSAAARAQPIP